MTTLRQNFIRELVIRGMAVRTQASYTRAVYGLAKYYRRSPDSLTDQELKEYLYHLAQGKKLAVSLINQAVCGLRHSFATHLLHWETCYQHTKQRGGILAL